MKKLLIIQFAFLFIAFGTIDLHAQITKKVFKQKVEKSWGENPYIKDVNICDLPDKEAPDPRVSRSNYCS